MFILILVSEHDELQWGIDGSNKTILFLTLGILSFPILVNPSQVFKLYKAPLCVKG